MANPKFTQKKSDNLIDTEEYTEMDNLNGVEVNNEDNSDSSNSNDSISINSGKIKVPQKNVKVKTNCNHRCCIGGTWYDFKKGEIQNVPLNVKTILDKSGLLAAL